MSVVPADVSHFLLKSQGLCRLGVQLEVHGKRKPLRIGGVEQHEGICGGSLHHQLSLLKAPMLGDEIDKSAPHSKRVNKVASAIGNQDPGLVGQKAKGEAVFFGLVAYGDAVEPLQSLEIFFPLQSHARRRRG